MISIKTASLVITLLISSQVTQASQLDAATDFFGMFNQAFQDDTVDMGYLGVVRRFKLSKYKENHIECEGRVCRVNYVDFLNSAQREISSAYCGEDSCISAPENWLNPWDAEALVKGWLYSDEAGYEVGMADAIRFICETKDNKVVSPTGSSYSWDNQTFCRTEEGDDLYCFKSGCTRAF